MDIYKNKQTQIISNDIISHEKIEFARKVIVGLQKEMPEYIQNGFGPFLAAIYDDKGQLVAKCANTVLKDTCSNSHAEVNAIHAAEEKYGTYDLSKYNLSLYVTAEPCIMCVGAIMWSGIKEIYYGIPSKGVEQITGFDEGFKPHWFKEFKDRGITVCGNIESDIGEEELKLYVNSNKTIYKPQR